jgi:hypothetical protein
MFENGLSVFTTDIYENIERDERGVGSIWSFCEEGA